MTGSKRWMEEEEKGGGGETGSHNRAPSSALKQGSKPSVARRAGYRSVTGPVIATRPTPPLLLLGHPLTHVKHREPEHGGISSWE